jgi:hypothetical protein
MREVQAIGKLLSGRAEYVGEDGAVQSLRKHQCRALPALGGAAGRADGNSSVSRWPMNELYRQENAMYLPKPNDADFELPPAGTHSAVCYRVIDLGTQDSSYKGQPKRQHKVMISWELPDEKMKDGRPFTISQRYTWSMSEKAALRRDLESWRGKPFTDADFGEGGFDIRKLLGVGCLLTIVHTEKGDKKYANIKSVSGLMKGMAPPVMSNPAMFLGLTEDHWQPDVFYKLSDNLQATIKASPEYAAIVNSFGQPDGPTLDAHETENPAPF